MVDFKDIKGGPGSLLFEKRYNDSSNWINNLIKINKNRLMNLTPQSGNTKSFSTIDQKRYHPYPHHQNAGRQQQKPVNVKGSSSISTSLANGTPIPVSTNSNNSTQAGQNSLMQIMIGSSSSIRGQFVCSNCNTDFSNRDSLAMHMMESVRNQSCSGIPPALVLPTQLPATNHSSNLFGGIELKQSSLNKELPKSFQGGDDGSNFLGRFQALQTIKQIMNTMDYPNHNHQQQQPSKSDGLGQASHQQMLFLSQLWQMAMTDMNLLSYMNQSQTMTGDISMLNNNNKRQMNGSTLSENKSLEKVEEKICKRSRSASGYERYSRRNLIERPEGSKSVPYTFPLESALDGSCSNENKVGDGLQLASKSQMDKISQRESMHAKNLEDRDRSLNKNRLYYTVSDEVKFSKTHKTTEVTMANNTTQTKSNGFTQSIQYSYHCKQCGIGFKDKTLYSLHMGLHTVNKPWQCNICGQNFEGKHEFASHALHF